MAAKGKAKESTSEATTAVGSPFFPLPTSPLLSDAITAVKAASTDPGEAAHAALHVAGWALGLFHKDKLGFGASPELAAKAAKLEACIEKCKALEGQGFKGGSDSSCIFCELFRVLAEFIEVYFAK